MKTLIALLLAITPYLVPCPQDHTLASATGNTRTVSGITECEYSHVHIYYDGDKDTTVDDKHVFWAPCAVKP